MESERTPTLLRPQRRVPQTFPVRAWVQPNPYSFFLHHQTTRIDQEVIMPIIGSLIAFSFFLTIFFYCYQMAKL